MVEAKEKMKTVNIKGKEYVEVNERVKYFVKEYVGWSIETEMLSNENGICIFKAVIRDESGIIRATGHAYEKEDSSFINKTSYIENCETSAVGRALGFLGIGIDTSIASSDEVNNAIKNQSTNRIDFKQVRERVNHIRTIEELNNYWNELGLSEKQASVLKPAFSERKVKITMGVGENGVE